MESIDFSLFNKPKYFPMWLCDGDTLNLAKLPDKQLEELDSQIISIADQFDIDSAGGAALDRIGKILGEDRNGNTDTVYRIYLKLRTMLNTANGTVEDIIRFVKFFFSSETVHLVPNYPAGLRILHDGSNDSVDFNRIIRQIVGAGISYDTRELFNMTDEFPFEDSDEKTVHRNEGDFFSRGTVLRNGRVLRDGVTVLDTQAVDLHRDGTVERNSSVKQRNGVRIVPAQGSVETPIYRNSGILDALFLGYARAFNDLWKSRLYRNGAVTRNGSETRSGRSDNSVNDTLLFDNVSKHDTEKFGIEETDEKTAAASFFDETGRGYERNRSILRNGKTYRESKTITDTVAVSGFCEPVVSDSWTVSDSFEAGRRYHFYRNGQYYRSSGITRKGGVLEAI